MSFTHVLTFFVPGLPKPGGSKTATVIRRKGGEIVMNNGRPLVTTRDDAKGNAEWKQEVRFNARLAYKADPLHGTLRVTWRFVMPRLKGHYGSGKNAGKLKPCAPQFHTVKPDLTKLIRSTEDACTGTIWADDATIAEFGPGTCKLYGERPGVHITVETLFGAPVSAVPSEARGVRSRDEERRGAE